MPASSRLLHGAAPAPFAGPTGQEGTHEQGSNGSKEGESIGMLKTEYAVIAGRFQGG